jgi:hypothetical protein
MDVSQYTVPKTQVPLLLHFDRPGMYPGLALTGEIDEPMFAFSNNPSLPSMCTRAGR